MQTTTAPLAKNNSHVQKEYLQEITSTGHVVMKTMNYDLFSFLNGNRDVHKLHQKRLRESFKKNMLFTVIYVNENYQIIDGQHRFEVCKELGLPIQFIILKGYGIREVQILNTNGKNWDSYDYLDGYCKEQLPEYLKMQKFMDDFPDFGIAGTFRILTQLKTGRKQTEIDGVKVNNNKDFENGYFKIPDLDKSYEIASKLQMFKPYFLKYYEPTFVSAMLGIFDNPEYNHAEMLTKLKYQPTELLPQKDVRQYRLLIESIYNYRRREKISLRY